MQRARGNPGRIKIIDASQSLNEVEQQIIDVLDLYLQNLWRSAISNYHISFICKMQLQVKTSDRTL